MTPYTRENVPFRLPLSSVRHYIITFGLQIFVGRRIDTNKYSYSDLGE